VGGRARAVASALARSTKTETGRHDDEEILDLRAAAAAIDRAGGALERARTHARLGVALRLAGRRAEARESLRLAVDLAHRSGAGDLEEQVVRELRAAGGRPRRRLISGVGALTPSERRVAELAAAGHRNRDIAEILVVTLSTVEWHLRHAYRKLGIPSRAKLTEVLPIAPGAGSPVLGGWNAALETGSRYRWEWRSSAATSTSWAGS
jgi:DNA-binding CsgD family transcriptional regulator